MNIFTSSRTVIARFFAVFALVSMVGGLVPAEVAAQSNPGAVWTTTGSCGAPQNINSYEVGETVYINGSGFATGTYAWSIKPAQGGNNAIAIASGNVTTDSSGAFCFAAIDLQTSNIGGPYKADVNGKNDNFSVVAAVVVQVPGCIDPLADNYDSLATLDDGSCTYTVPGCTDPAANNYNPLANSDNGSCTFDPGPVAGCTDSTATNYSPTATVDDGSCVFPPVLGCIDPNATNYNPLATEDDGSCIFPPATCTVEIVSSSSAYVIERDTQAVPTYVHNAWTADEDVNLTGATWIWADALVQDPTNVEVYTFQNQFGFAGVVTAATLYVASDNSHQVTVNTNNFAEFTGTSFNAAQSYDVTANILQGNNELAIEVTNFAGQNSPQSNPAGALYRLVVEGEVTSDADCAIDYVPVVPGCTDVTADNYNPDATVDNNSCTYPPVLGCTDPQATNYNPLADTDDNSCDYDGGGNGPDPVCSIGDNLLLNGSFEEPAIGSAWTLTAISDWIVTKVSDSSSTLGEIWRGLGIGPSDGEQNVELAAAQSTQLAQTVATTPGATYELKFDFAARNSTVSDNNVDALINGGILINANTGVTEWTTYSDTFVAASTTTEITFRDADPSNNSLGSLIDNAVLCYVSDPVVEEEDTYIIEGYVWHDDNRNEDWDGFQEETPTEDPLSGWTVTITNGQFSTTTVTDASGYYSFEVPAGTWTITEVEQAGWIRTTQASHTVTVPAPAQVSLLQAAMSFIIPTAHAAVVGTYGTYNFGNDRRSSGGGGGLATPVDRNDNSNNVPSGEVLGATTAEPIVLGEQVSAVPVGAPDTGRGGATQNLLVLGQFLTTVRKRTL